MELLHSYIDSLAPNASAVKNGKSLANNKFQQLNISEDETLLFGECAGSGKKPYICSVDFIDKDNPVARCSCPSRQIPCKHALGLMYAYADGKAFAAADIPEDVVNKREKLGKRAENKEKKQNEMKESAKVKKAPTKAQETAALKKLKQQYEGLQLADKMYKNILQMGLASLDEAAVKNMGVQIKELGNYYINGIQTAFQELILNLKADKSGSYQKPMESLIYIGSLLKRAKEHITEKMEHPNLVFELNVTSEIEEQIGHAWKLEELMRYDKYIENSQLVQLSFYSYDDESRKEYVDEGYYICLLDGEIYKTVNYRPYKALKYIKEDDSIFDMVEVPELFIYPGGLNKRIRWDKYNISEIDGAAYEKIIGFAKGNYSEVIKTVKNQIKNPLSNKNPLLLLQIDNIYTIESESECCLELSDSAGMGQILSDDGYIHIKTVDFMKRIHLGLIKHGALLVMFHNNIETGQLTAKPLSIITKEGIIRLLF